AARVAGARERLGRVRLGERLLLLVAGTCARLGVDGMRADIVCARTACALAALDGADEVGEEHGRRAALLARAHRRPRGPLDPPPVAPERRDPAAPAGHPPLLQLLGRGRGAAGRRSRAVGPEGAPIDAREPRGPLTDLAPVATLRAAALRRAAAGAQAPSGS